MAAFPICLLLPWAAAALLTLSVLGDAGFVVFIAGLSACVWAAVAASGADDGDPVLLHLRRGGGLLILVAAASFLFPGASRGLPGGVFFCSSIVALSGFVLRNLGTPNGDRLQGLASRRPEAGSLGS